MCGILYVRGRRQDRLHYDDGHRVQRAVRGGQDVLDLGQHPVHRMCGILYVRGRHQDRLHYDDGHHVQRAV